jgi:L,D-transpeptidase ErfK/SrfK
MYTSEPNKELPPMRRHNAVALCLIGVWFSSGCNLATLPGKDGNLPGKDGNLRETTIYRAAYQDTLLELARKFGLGYVEIVAANPGTDPWLPGEGTDLVLPTVHLMPDAKPEGIVINLADMRLYFFEKPDAPPRSYPIGIGREGLTTPLGSTEIVRKTKDPTWHPTERMRSENPDLPEAIPPGPDNPMGTRAMYIGWSPYAIHGTNKPLGIGRRSSSGCIRMYPEDAEELYDLVTIGTRVTVVDQPITTGWIDGELYVEAHPTQAQSDQLEALGRFDPTLPSGVVAKVLAVAGDQAARLDWSRVWQATVERRGYPIRITR